MKLDERLQAASAAALGGISAGARKANELLKAANRPELERLGLDHLTPGGYRWLLKVETAQAKARAADRARARESVYEALGAYARRRHEFEQKELWELEKPPEEPLSRTGAQGYYKPMSWYRDATPAEIAEWDRREAQHRAWGLHIPPEDREPKGGTE